jgi:hypothetical protein
VLPVNPLHLSDPRLAQTRRLVKRIVEQGPEPLVNARMLRLSVGIFFPSKLDLNRCAFITLVF